MKVSADDFARLRAAIEPLDTEERRARYRAGDFPRAAAVRDLDKRYRWDLFWTVWATDKLGFRFDGGGYPYNDAHIDTALRKIVRPLTSPGGQAADRLSELRRCSGCNHDIGEYAPGLTICAACDDEGSSL